MIINTSNFNAELIEIQNFNSKTINELNQFLRILNLEYLAPISDWEQNDIFDWKDNTEIEYFDRLDDK